jgi:glyoxylase-like metal-dependent hydrolase (beta-lactamase superfamily II)
MALEILSLQLGPMENNTYVAADVSSGQAVVIDPSFDSEVILPEIEQRGWSLSAIWLTHAHFDHIAGVKALLSASSPPPAVGLHPADLPLWQQGGGARIFGLEIELGPEPSLSFVDGSTLQLGDNSFEVRHTPGHTTGHVVFYCAQEAVVFCGDLIFYHGVGRTDLPGGDHRTLLRSIREQILTLPPATRLLSGHGPETTVAEEQAANPFL